MTARRVAIVGLGLIGSSLGGALRRSGANVQGYDPDAVSREIAARRGYVAAAHDDLPSCLRDAQVVIVAAPVPAILELLATVDAAAPEAVLLDTGSVKVPVVTAMEALPGAKRAIGGHPLAGKERSGPESADPELFRNRPFVLTPHAHTSGRTLDVARRLVEEIGARAVVASAEEHDTIIARTSHLPQVLATALAREIAPGDGRFAGPALYDMTRLALSDSALWTDILLANGGNLVPRIRRLAASLEEIARWVEGGEAAALSDVLRTGRERALGLRGGVAA